MGKPTAPSNPSSPLFFGKLKIFWQTYAITKGNFYQLAPINKSYIFQQTRINRRAANNETNLCKVFFKIYRI